MAFTVNTVLEFQLPGNWTSNYDPNVVHHAEAVDRYTVKFVFKEKPGLSRWQYGASQGVIVSKAYWEPKVAAARRAGEGKTDEEKTKAMQEVLFAVPATDEPTAGELRFKRWEPGAFVETDKNPNYYFAGTRVVEYQSGAYLEEKPGVYREEAYGTPTGDVELEFTRGPYVDSVIYSVYKSQDAAILALRAGEISYILSPLGLAASLQRQVADRPELATIENPANGFRFLGFNTRRPPQDSKEFRQAVATLIDKEFLSQTVLQGVAIPVYTLVPEGNSLWHNPSVSQMGKGLSRDERVKRAVELLKSAGFTWDVEPQWDAVKRAVDPVGKGLRMSDGQPVPAIELLAPSAGYDPLRATAAIWIERWLNEVGIPVRANLTGFNVIVPRVFSQQDFDMWILGWGLTIFPDYLADFFHSQRSGPGDQNAGGYSNPEFDALADKLTTATETTEAQKVAFQLQEILAEELPYVVLFTTPILEVHRTDVQWPYTAVLDGLQGYFQGMNGPISATKIE